MQSSATKLVRGLTTAVFVIGGVFASASLAQDANAARRSRNSQNLEWYYDSSPARPLEGQPFAGSRDGRFDPIPPSANGG